MATYKLIQDIEAEDHILGPLSLRQFIFALVGAFCLYMSFIGFAKHIIVLDILFIPPAMLAIFFAVPFGKDQPTEVWATAKLRFLFKPRRRIWDQSGVKELVTITVPKKIERVLTDGLSETEVRSRLQALASTIDTRGWATKNVGVNLYAQTGSIINPSSDRLIDIAAVPQEVPNFEIRAADDILDEVSNPIAQQFDQMINASTQAHRQEILAKMGAAGSAPVRTAVPATQAPALPADYWFLNQPAPGGDQAQMVQPGGDYGGAQAQTATADEAALVAQLKAQSNSQQISYSHLRTIQPLGSQPPPKLDAPIVQPTDDIATPQPQAQAVTAPPDAAILSLANNNDLNVATLARQAQKAKDQDVLNDEVVISLH